jgi:SAM-dependent methyltransferase
VPDPKDSAMTDSTPARPRRPEDFDFLYRVPPPWDIGRPQPAFVALAQTGAIQGRVLDVGCGTGEHALMAAELGFDATGVDMAAAAIEAAKRKARDRSLSARFLVWDAFELAALDEQFDTVLDSGLFHVFPNDDRPTFVENLRAVIPVGGCYFMLCFSELQPGDWGPRRVTRKEIRASFDEGWRVDSIEPASFDVTIDLNGQLCLPSHQGGVDVVDLGLQGDGAHAWLAAITRT